MKRMRNSLPFSLDLVQNVIAPSMPNLPNNTLEIHVVFFCNTANKQIKLMSFHEVTGVLYPTKPYPMYKVTKCNNGDVSLQDAVFSYPSFTNI